jgi:HEAT repeat protein
MLAAGCGPLARPQWMHDVETSPDDSGTTAVEKAAARPSELAALNQGVWIRTFQLNGAAPDPDGFRWHSPAIDEILTMPVDKQPNFTALLTSQQPLVAINAAIVLARLGQQIPQETLVEAVRDQTLKLPLRRAAIEALGRGEKPSALKPLQELADQYGNFEKSSTGYIPELHAELLYALARQEDPAEDPRFVAAVRSPAIEVRLAILESWARGSTGGLPLEVADLRGDPKERVRAAALTALVARHDPQGLEYARRALLDSSLDVKLAAIAALGRVSEDAARADLEKLLTSESEIIRGAVVSALSQRGANDVVLRTGHDKSWRVRRVVAELLATQSGPEVTALAYELLSDRSIEVQCQIVASLEKWPLDSAGPLYLRALEQGGYPTRKAAALQFRRHWPAAVKFSADAPPERRQEQLVELREIWGKEHPLLNAATPATQVAEQKPVVHEPSQSQLDQAQRWVLELSSDRSDEARENLAGLGPELVPVLEKLAIDRQLLLLPVVYRDVLRKRGPEFEALDSLDSTNVEERRRGASRLARLASEAQLRPLVVLRLSELGCKEPDALVCRTLIAAVEGDHGPQAVQLLSATASHPSDDIRRLAIEQLGQLPQPAQVPILLPALKDEDMRVVRAAVQALGHLGMLEDPAPLEKLLTTTNKSLRLDVAMSLSRLKSPKGPPELILLARDPDPEVRRHAALYMGELGDRTYLPSLIELLDDPLGARRAALESLPRITGHDIVAEEGKAELNSEEKIDRWKKWYTHEQALADPPGDAEKIGPR